MGRRRSFHGAHSRGTNWRSHPRKLESVLSERVRGRVIRRVIGMPCWWWPQNWFGCRSVGRLVGKGGGDLDCQLVCKRNSEWGRRLSVCELELERRQPARPTFEGVGPVVGRLDWALLELPAPWLTSLVRCRRVPGHDRRQRIWHAMANHYIWPWYTQMQYG